MDPAVFRQAQTFDKAMLAYEKALYWQDLFDIAVQQKMPKDEIVEVAYRVAGASDRHLFLGREFHSMGDLEDLSSKKRHQDSARVYLDYAKDVRQAVIALVEGSFFSEARRVVRLCALIRLIRH